MSIVTEVELETNEQVFHCKLLTMDTITHSLYRVIIRTENARMNYKPGQYLKILSPNGSWLPFSIANSANNSHEIELHIRCNQQDENLAALVNQFAKQEIVISGPYGNSYFNANVFSKILIIAVGTGFAPAKAILEFIISSRQYPNYLHLYWGARNEEDFYLPLLPKQWQLTNNWFYYTNVLTQGSSLEENKTNILEHILKKYSDLSEYQVYFYGPEAMAKRVQEKLLMIGLHPNNLFSDML